MLRQFLLNLKKNLPQHYVEAVPAESQKDSAPKFKKLNSSHQISKRIQPKITWRQFLPNLKKNLPQNYV